MTTLESSFGQTPLTGQKTSGLAIASLICSLICCLPITTVPAILLGIGAVVSIHGNPAKKGMGLAVTGLILGLIFTGTQALVYPKAYKIFNDWYEVIYFGPDRAMTAGMGGDIAGFKGWFHGAGATATDAEAQAFLDTVHDRYGSFSVVRFDEQNQPPPQFGSPVVTFAYLFEFSGASGTLSGESEVVFSDPQRGGLITKLGSITIFDADDGDLTYPASAGQAPPIVPAPPQPNPVPPPATAPDIADDGGMIEDDLMTDDDAIADDDTAPVTEDEPGSADDG